jgi:hypothetical protein
MASQAASSQVTIKSQGLRQELAHSAKQIFLWPPPSLSPPAPAAPNPRKRSSQLQVKLASYPRRLFQSQWNPMAPLPRFGTSTTRWRRCAAEASAIGAGPSRRRWRTCAVEGGSGVAQSTARCRPTPASPRLTHAISRLNSSCHAEEAGELETVDTFWVLGRERRRVHRDPLQGRRRKLVLALQLAVLRRG